MSGGPQQLVHGSRHGSLAGGPVGQGSSAGGLQRSTAAGRCLEIIVVIGSTSR